MQNSCSAVLTSLLLVGTTATATAAEGQVTASRNSIRFIILRVGVGLASQAPAPCVDEGHVGTRSHHDDV
jgi:hypothetical protein